MSIDDQFRIAFRPSGVAVLVLALLLFCLGGLKVDGACMTVGLTLGMLLILVAWVAARNLRGLEVQLNMPAAVTVGGEFPIRLRVSAPHRRHDAFALRADLHLAGLRELNLEIAWLAAGSAAFPEMQVSLPKRGFFEAHPFRLSSTFPLGWFEAERWGRLSDSIAVKPRFANLQLLLDEWPGNAINGVTISQSAAFQLGGDWRGLRPWRVGDSHRRIHWPSSLRQVARGGQSGWMVLDEDSLAPDWSSCLVVFHSWGCRGGLIRLDRFERGISLMAGLIRNVRRSGCRCRWTADFSGWKLQPVETSAQWQMTLEGFALANRCSETEWHQVINAVSRASPAEAVLVISDVPTSAWALFVPRREALHAISPPWSPETTRLLHPT